MSARRFIGTLQIFLNNEVLSFNPAAMKQLWMENWSRRIIFLPGNKQQKTGGKR
jgi:hypothetical protein